MALSKNTNFNASKSWLLMQSATSENAGITHHMPLKLFFALHKIKAKLTKVQLHRVIIFWRKGGEIPCVYLISSKFNFGNIFHFSEFLMFAQTSSIKFFMACLFKNGIISVRIIVLQDWLVKHNSRTRPQHVSHQSSAFDDGSFLSLLPGLKKHKNTETLYQY